MDNFFAIQAAYTSLCATYVFPQLWHRLTPLHSWSWVALIVVSFFAYAVESLCARFEPSEAVLRSAVIAAIPVVLGPVMYWVCKNGVWRKE